MNNNKNIEVSNNLVVLNNSLVASFRAKLVFFRYPLNLSHLCTIHVITTALKHFNNLFNNKKIIFNHLIFVEIVNDKQVLCVLLEFKKVFLFDNLDSLTIKINNKSYRGEYIPGRETKHKSNKKLKSAIIKLVLDYKYKILTNMCLDNLNNNNNPTKKFNIKSKNVHFIYSNLPNDKILQTKYMEDTLVHYSELFKHNKVGSNFNYIIFIENGWNNTLELHTFFEFSEPILFSSKEKLTLNFNKKQYIGIYKSTTKTFKRRFIENFNSNNVPVITNINLNSDVLIKKKHVQKKIVKTKKLFCLYSGYTKRESPADSFTLQMDALAHFEELFKKKNVDSFEYLIYYYSDPNSHTSNIHVYLKFKEAVAFSDPKELTIICRKTKLLHTPEYKAAYKTDVSKHLEIVNKDEDKTSIVTNMTDIDNKVNANSMDKLYLDTACLYCEYPMINELYMDEYSESAILEMGFDHFINLFKNRITYEYLAFYRVDEERTETTKRKFSLCFYFEFPRAALFTSKQNLALKLNDEGYETIVDSMGYNKGIKKIAKYKFDTEKIYNGIYMDKQHDKGFKDKLLDEVTTDGYKKHIYQCCQGSMIRDDIPDYSIDHNIFDEIVNYNEKDK